MAHFHDNALVGASGQGGYQISRSLRFNSADSAYLNRTPASAGSRRIATWSGWIKLGNHTSTGEYYLLCTNGTSDSTFFYIQIRNNQLRFGQFNSGTFALYSAQLFRDPSAWYHIVVAVDTTQATASNRAKAYVNGTEITGWSTANYPAQNNDLGINDTRAHAIGAGYASGSPYAYWDGYVTETYLIDGQALTPSSFGETDTITGVWKPKKYAGTYGTNGFYLNFSDNSGTTSTTLGKDSSGNGNNWTPNNFSVTAGAGNDSMIDTPTPYIDGGNNRGNYATLNPLDQYSGNLMNGNLEFAGTYAGQNGIGCRGTLAVPSSGKWYAEAANVTYSGSGNSCMLGFTSSNQSISTSGFAGTLTPWIGVDASVFSNSIRLSWNGVSGGTTHNTVLFASYASGDVINFAIDFGAGKFWVGKNGTWYNSGNPAAGTNPTSTFTAGTDPWRFWGEYVASSDNGNRSSVVANFGQRPFAYTPPSGFVALNTQNLPEPSIKKPSSYFDAKLYTGTAATLNITGLGFSPDLVWTKNRSSINNNRLYDVLRGTTKELYSNTTDAETTDANSLTAFNSDGFTLGSSSGPNNSGSSYVAWCWDESATPGFDIVTYTGNGVNTRTISHNLGVTPAFFITKNRDGYNSSQSFNDWNVYHQNLPAYNTTGSQALYLMSTTNAGQAGGFFTRPTSTVFTPNQTGYDNVSTRTYVAYLWSEVAGFSKFGSYTGNGSTDGPFVFCGFRPRFILFKNTTSFNWQILDTARADYNQGTVTLFPNLSNAENTTATQYDILSNGFKIRTSDAGSNGSGNSIIFAAFSESAFKYALAR